MEKDLVAVLGGGNGGHAVAANLSLAGFKVNFFELPQFADSFERVLRTREIRIEGVSIDGVAKVNLATTDIEQAIKDGAIRPSEVQFRAEGCLKPEWFVRRTLLA